MRGCDTGKFVTCGVTIDTSVTDAFLSHGGRFSCLKGSCNLVAESYNLGERLLKLSDDPSCFDRPFDDRRWSKSGHPIEPARNSCRILCTE